MRNTRAAHIQKMVSRLNRSQTEKLALILAHFPERNLFVFRSLMAGHKQGEIASALGVSQPMVSRIINQTIQALGEVIQCG